MNTGLIYEEKIKDFETRLPLKKKERDQAGTLKKKIIVISGPTATGKTKLSLTVAKALEGEIISADSMQVYKGMDIGTAKASIQERAVVPHHLIDIRNIHELYNAADFYRDAWEACHDILRRNKVPIIVGGTGFYIHVFIYGPPKGPPSVPEIRQRLERDLEKYGTEMLFEKLKSYDPLYASTITQGDKHKIVRALEIITISSKKVSDFGRENVDYIPYDFRCWFLYLPKEILYPRIEQRCDEMIAQGFLDEVKHLLEEGLLQNPSASQAIGYRQAMDFLKTPQTEKDKDLFLKTFKMASKRYAKRQLTWFRKELLFRWLDLQKYPLSQAAELILQDFELHPRQ